MCHGTRGEGDSGPVLIVFFFFNDPAPTEFYPLPLRAALPISRQHATHQPLAHQVGAEPEPVAVVAGRGGEVDRSLAYLIFDDLQDGELRALEIGTTQNIRVEIGRAHV